MGPESNMFAKSLNKKLDLPKINEKPFLQNPLL